MNKRIIALTLALAFLIPCVSCAFISNPPAYADGDSGSGSSGQGNSSGNACTDNGTTSILVCNDKTGGWSWHVFRTSDLIWPNYLLYTDGPSYCRESYEAGKKCKPIERLKDGGYDKLLAARCPKSEYDYYVALVYDGWNGNNNGTKSNYPTYWGPAGWGEKVDYGDTSKLPEYNNNDALSYEVFRGALASGANLHQAKLTEQAATTICAEDVSSGPCGRVGPGGAIPIGTGYMCVNDKATLTAYGIDITNGANTILWGPVENKVKRGQPASISRRDIEGYTFIRWDNNAVCPDSTSNECSTISLNGDATVNAYYEKNIFEGQSTVSGATSASVGYTTTGGSATGYINNCSPTSGCKVTFTHNMRRSLGTGSTTYSVTRESNMITSSRAISAGTLVGTTTWSGSPTTVKTDGPHTLYPGMVVCEKLTFVPYNTPGASSVTNTVCASALGNAQPPDPNQDTPEDPNTNSGDTSFINIKVRNASVPAYSNYMREVYAKPGYIDESGNVHPGDDLYYRATYNPVLQYTYYLIPQQMSIDNGGIISNSSKSMLGHLFNAKRGSRQPWNNAFKIQYSSSNPSQYSDLTPPAVYTSTLGDTARKRPDPNKQKVTASHVGNSVNERAITNEANNIRTTPSQVSFTKNSGSNLGTVYTSQKVKEAFARVPYNFVNTIEMNNQDQPYYAGESGQAKALIKVKPRRNNTTDGTYATYVKNAKWQLRICYSVNGVEVCNRTDEISPNGNNTLNSNGDIKGSEDEKSIDFIVPDVPAGTSICLSTRVFPSNSGSDKNWQDASGSNSWTDWSQPSCHLVAKRPSIQIWGGNVFSGGDFRTGLSIKKILYGYDGYDSEDKANVNPSQKDPYTFGSWGELGVISKGTVTGFASGATLGYVSNLSGNLNPVPYKNALDLSPNTKGSVGDNPGGSRRSDFCKYLSILTFANNCSSEKSHSVTGTGGKDATEGIKIDKDALEALATNGLSEQPIPSNTINLKDLSNEIMYSSDNDFTIAESTLYRHGFKIVASKNGNITITGNIAISPEDTFEKFSHTPKAVIYAKNTIFIDCAVSRIDALLVANSVVTCNNLAGDGALSQDNVKNAINDERNSNQLVVNGAIVANRLYANRTYGAARGANSIVPAEIINFDPVLYLWGGVVGSKSENSNDNKIITGNLETASVHELAPRY